MNVGTSRSFSFCAAALKAAVLLANRGDCEEDDTMKIDEAQSMVEVEFDIVRVQHVHRLFDPVPHHSDVLPNSTACSVTGDLDICVAELLNVELTRSPVRG